MVLHLGCGRTDKGAETTGPSPRDRGHLPGAEAVLAGETVETVRQNGCGSGASLREQNFGLGKQPQLAAEVEGGSVRDACSNS